MKRFRVVMITPYIDPVLGGITTYVRNLSETLRRQGLEVVVISRSGARGDDVCVIEGRPNAFAREAAKTARALQPDALHAHAHWYALQACRAARGKSQKRLVFTFHTAPRPQSFLERRIFQRMLSTCDYVTFPSEYLKNQVKMTLPKQTTRIIHPGVFCDTTGGERVPHDSQSDSKPVTATTIGYVGNFEWPDKVRGLRILLESMTRPGLKKVRLIIAGGGSLLEDVQRTVNSLSLTDRVFLLGAVKNPDRVYRDCHIYCHPSFQEGMSIAVLEAMSNGRPVVGFRTGSMSESVRDGVDGLLVDPEPGALGAALEALAANPLLVNTLGDSARAHMARDFSWETSAHEFMTLYGVKP